MNERQRLLFFSPRTNLSVSAHTGTPWMTGYLEPIYILLAYRSLFSPMSALFPSKLLSTSSIWLPSQIRTEGLKSADGRRQHCTSLYQIEKYKDFLTKKLAKTLLCLDLEQALKLIPTKAPLSCNLMSLLLDQIHEYIFLGTHILRTCSIFARRRLHSEPSIWKAFHIKTCLRLWKFKTFKTAAWIPKEDQIIHFNDNLFWQCKLNFLLWEGVSSLSGIKGSTLSCTIILLLTFK